MDQQVASKSYSLTKAQKRIWFNSKLLDKPLPNIAMVFELNGNLDIWALRKAIENLVKENSVLKSTIYSSTDALERIINPTVRGNLEIVDLTEVSKKTDIFWLLQNIVSTSFNLGTGPLFHFHLIKEEQDHFYFTILIHPIIVDRYSLKYLVAEISRQYNLITNSSDSTYKEELFDFNNIVELEKKFNSTDKSRQGLTHWTNTLKSNQFFLDLPKAGYFPGQEYVDSPFFEVFINEAISKRIKEFALSHQVDFSMVLLAGYQVLLKRYTGNNNIIVNYSSPVSYTDKKVFGCLENRLPLRVLLTEKISFNELLNLTKNQLSYDTYYKDIQITDIVKSVRDRYDSRFSGVFSNTSFDKNYLPYNELQLGAVTAKLIPKFMKKFVTENIAFYYKDAGNTISIIADFDEHIDGTAVKNLMWHFETLLVNCIHNPTKPISELPMLTELEYQQIVVDWNNTQADYPHELVHHLFEKQVLDTPEKLALVFEDQHLTYQQLNHMTNQLAYTIANKLEQFRGNEKDLYVGICLDRGLEMIVSKIAILKAGAAYVPLDPQFPHERLSYILNDCQCKVVISKQELLDKLTFLPDKQRQIICFDSDAAEINAQPLENPGIKVALSDVAYVIYTSGSTGLPKGVMIEHKSIPNLIAAWREYFQVTSESKVLQFVSMNFDVAVPDVFCTLTHGACLYIVSEDLKQSPEKLFQYLEENAITTAFITPAFLRLLPKQPLPALQVLSFGGDVCDPETAEYWMKDRVFLNGYGPTETTVAATYSRPLKPGDQIACIGRPLQNLTAYILDEHLNPVPIGMIGELYVGGLGVGRGYINRPDLTAQRFVPDIFKESKAKMYKTGDLVRWLPDGSIEYIGRADFEVKIRGFRIQLGDIEYIMQSYPDVTQVITKVWEKSGMEKMIAAYYILKEGAKVNVRELRDHVQRYLPEYMVPSFFIELDEMPIAVSGKINKALLPDPMPKTTSGAVEGHEEQVLKEIWTELFKISSDAVTGQSDFFDLGGHSLLATQLVSRIKNKLNVEITVKDVFQNSQLKRLAKLIRESQVSQAVRFSIEKAPMADYYEPSHSQKRLWYCYKAVPKDRTYNLLTVIRFSNNVDIIALRKSLYKLLSSHENFRTSFVERTGEVNLKIHDAMVCDIPLVDCHTPEDIQKEIEKERNHIFNLAQLPLFRCRLLLSETAGVTLLFNIHHIVFDGWSLHVFMRELEELYMHITQQKLPSSIPCPFEFKDFAYSQNLWEKASLFDSQMTYWQRKLYKPLPVLELPTDFKRPNIATFEGDSLRFDLPENLVIAIKKLAFSNKTSLFSFLLSAYYVFLYRITHQNDLIVASPIANRTQQDLESLIGFCVNVVAYRAQFRPNMQFDELLKMVHEDVILTQENQDLPFDIIVNQMHSSRDTSRNPIFQSIFVLQNGFKLANKWIGCDVEYNITEEHTRTSKVDLSLILYDNSASDAISGYIEFNTALYAKETIGRYIQYFINILRSVSENVQRVVDNISMLPTEEYRLCVYDWNNTYHNIAYETASQAFERQVEITPGQVAITYLQEQLTYHELNSRANQLARYIRKQFFGVTKQELTADTFIGLCIDRGLDMVVSILAILKAGAAYMPLDPSYPRERLTYMLNDSGVKVIISKNEILEKVDILKMNHLQVICLDDNREAIKLENPFNLTLDVKPTNLAYIIYTSGSTGLPKGVMVEHKGVVNLAYALRDLYGLTIKDKITQFASINFDGAVYEIFETLLSGASLYIVPESVRSSPDKLVDYLDENHITSTALPPALLRILPRRELSSLRALTFAGDTCDQETLEYWGKSRNFYNSYGPTETTVCATLALLKPTDSVNCVGKPLPNLKVYVLDDNLSPVPMGVLGELYVGGMGLARGYLNRPDLTVERFIVNPFSDNPAERIYKTGDIVRWSHEGSLEYIGRSDFQVQIRGFRVELGEIEEVLIQYHGIRQVAVIAVGDDISKQLLAYFTLVNPNDIITIEELRKFLQSRLPDYMVPSVFVKIDKMPLSLSGKIDKKALPKLDEAQVVAQNNYVAPRNEIEGQLVQIWGSLFNHQKIGIRDNFFNFGGNSLLSIRMLALVKEKFNRDISLAKFFQRPFIEGLADLIAGKDQAIDVFSAVIADAEQQVIHSPVEYAEKLEVRQILLTGANGFLGVYLLSSLLHHTTADIYCLIRHTDLQQAKEKLKSTLKKFALHDAVDNPRVHILLGDLSREKLGMDAIQWEFLQEEIDVVYHNGALVNHIYDYQILKSTNVGSTVELLKLCASKKPKAFHYISTGSAASQFSEEGIALEAGPANKPPLGPGYILTKWASERITYRAAEQGLNVSIYRPGNITGHTKTGAVNFENNHALLLLKSCIQLGVAPLFNAEIEMTPVDILSEAIVRLSLQSTTNNKHVYHLGNPSKLSWERYFSMVNSLGFKLNLISPDEWVSRYIKYLSEDNALYPLREIYMNGQGNPEQMHFETKNTQECLRGLGVTYPETSKDQIKIYLEYLKEQKFLEDSISKTQYI